jgi:hypothetical protein
MSMAGCHFTPSLLVTRAAMLSISSPFMFWRAEHLIHGGNEGRVDVALCSVGILAELFAWCRRLMQRHTDFLSLGGGSM